MTSEEIKAAIDRLQVLTETDIVTALTGEYGWTDKRARECLIDLLRQADPDAHIELPVDADGEYIHIGDELISNHSKKRFVVTRLKYSRKHAWMIGGADKDDLSEYSLYSPCETHHYNKPTIEGVLRELVNEWIEADSESDIFAEYADRLRKVIADED